MIISVAASSIMASVRIPPVMPKDAEHSGYCCVAFDITEDGWSTNVQAISCTNDIFKESAEKAVRQWRHIDFSGEIPATRNDRVMKISFRITDENGQVIYDPAEYSPYDSEGYNPGRWVCPDSRS